MASGSRDDAAESAEPAAAPGTAEREEEIEHLVKKRRLQCMGFALVAKCDTMMAHTFLSENDWQTEVSLRFSLPSSRVGGACSPSSCLFFSESAERLLRTYGEGPRVATPASDVLQVRGLVSHGDLAACCGAALGIRREDLEVAAGAAQGWKSERMVLSEDHDHSQRDLLLLLLFV